MKKVSSTIMKKVNGGGTYVKTCMYSSLSCDYKQEYTYWGPTYLIVWAIAEVELQKHMKECHNL